MLRNSVVALIVVALLAACSASQKHSAKYKPIDASEIKYDLSVLRSRLHNNVYFDFDSAKIKESAIEHLKRVAEVMQSSPEYLVFMVEGHADAVGSRRYNKDLGRQRAIAVRDFLQAQGVAPDRMVVTSRGESELAVATGEKEALNRRIQFLWKDKRNADSEGSTMFTLREKDL